MITLKKITAIFAAMTLGASMMLASPAAAYTPQEIAAAYAAQAAAESTMDNAWFLYFQHNTTYYDDYVEMVDFCNDEMIAYGNSANWHDCLDAADLWYYDQPAISAALYQDFLDAQLLYYDAWDYYILVSSNPDP